MKAITSTVWGFVRSIRFFHLKALAFGFLTFAAVLTVESKSAIAALHQVGLQWAIISAIFATLGTFGFGHAANLKDDYRDHVRRRAFFTRSVAVIFMLVPICFLGAAMKQDNMRQRWAAYTATGEHGEPSLYTQDQATVAQPANYDVEERQAARERLQKRPGATDLDLTDAEFWQAAFLALVLLFGADAFRVPVPMTKEEFEYLKRSTAAKKAAETRKRRKAARESKPRLVSSK